MEETKELAGFSIDPKDIDLEMVLQNIQKERKRMLEGSFPVSGSPTFVIELYKESGEAFSLEDIRTAVKVRNDLIGEGRNAVDHIHREAEGLHVSGVLLTPDGLENFQEVLRQLDTPPEERDDSLYNPDLKFRVAMATPHKGGVQYIKVAQNGEHFTIFGPAVLAATRGSGKVTTSNPREIPVYRLATKEDDAAAQTIEDKNTVVVQRSLQNTDFEWAKQEEIDVLPEILFRKTDPGSIYQLSVDVNKFMAIKADINDSGDKIIKKIDSDDPLGSSEEVQLIVSANFELESVVEDYLRLRAEQHGEFFAAFNRLGESRVYLFQRQSNSDPSEPSMIRTAFEAYMRDLAERGVPDVFLTAAEVEKYINELIAKRDGQETPTRSMERGDDKQDLLQKILELQNVQPRQARLGHLTNIELPVNGIVNLYFTREDDQVIAIDQIWSKEEEKRREDEHKKRGMTPSQIYTPEDRRPA